MAYIAFDILRVYVSRLLNPGRQVREIMQIQLFILKFQTVPYKKIIILKIRRVEIGRARELSLSLRDRCPDPCACYYSGLKLKIPNIQTTTNCSL